MSNARSTTFDSARCESREGGRTFGAAGAIHTSRAVSAVAARTLRQALPQACALCAARCGDALLCPACAARLPYLREACPVCALPVIGAMVCGACLRRPPPFSATISPLIYAFPVDRLLQDMKYRSRLALAAWAAAELAVAAGRALGARKVEERPDRIVALPLTAVRQRERGFNQAHEIARRVARCIGVPLADALMRTGAALPQAVLPWSSRARNVRGVFACRRDVRGARIALIDDVMTTGATLAEAAAILRRAGAARVECWVVARTLPPGNR